MPKAITVLSNLSFEAQWQLCIKERKSCAFSDTLYNYISYEEYYESAKNIRSAEVIAVCLNFEELYPDLSGNILSGKVTYEAVENDCIQRCKNLYLYVKNHSKAHVIWFGFEDYYSLHSKNYGSILPFDGLVDNINLRLYDMCKGDTFIDFKRLVANIGVKNAYDNKGKYRWNSPYSKDLINSMIDELEKQYLIITGDTKKCLILDCDNVLWGGILSEDGIEGIQIGNSGLGRQYKDFQRYLLDLYYHGIILAVCSKNDEADVSRVFNEHTGMLLKEEHIACFACNWNDKPGNIESISKMLNISLDSIVFVDDSIFEIESVKTILPDIKAVLYKRDSVYNELSCFNIRLDTDFQTVSDRIDTYKTNIKRAELLKSSSSYEDYISSLEMIVDIHKTTESELARVSELTQRTNKCTNGVRYTLEHLKVIMSFDDYQIFTVCLSDRFSSLGVVGVIGLKDNSIDLFSLSCRALGRDVENEMLKYAIKVGAKRARFFDSGKNELMKSLFNMYGLKLSE